jgi:hypothetical protein
MDTTRTVGRTVHYVSHGTPPRPDGSQAFAPACRAAIHCVREQAEGPQHTDATPRLVKHLAPFSPLVLGSATHHAYQAPLIGTPFSEPDAERAPAGLSGGGPCAFNGPRLRTLPVGEKMADETLSACRQRGGALASV